eukprot:TRINITY_DN794_c0_g1_i2.p1 TRINITY_DN794_c0_g1~~TRINITY_DN794_c0_g1_i2.p1  ORF type:complete len:208 (+),score=41.28 TRINITY_DN794_c0_g1_i2:77-625(+)
MEDDIERTHSRRRSTSPGREHAHPRRPPPSHTSHSPSRRSPLRRSRRSRSPPRRSRSPVRSDRSYIRRRHHSPSPPRDYRRRDGRDGSERDYDDYDGGYDRGGHEAEPRSRKRRHLSEREEAPLDPELARALDAKEFAKEKERHEKERSSTIDISALISQGLSSEDIMSTLGFKTSFDSTKV